MFRFLPFGLSATRLHQAWLGRLSGIDWGCLAATGAVAECRGAFLSRDDSLAVAPTTSTESCIDEHPDDRHCPKIKQLGYEHIPSQANFIMIDMKRPVRPLIDSMNRSGVSVGRAFPALPNHMRVTIGKQDEMEAFLAAFRKTVSA